MTNRRECLVSAAAAIAVTAGAWMPIAGAHANGTESAWARIQRTKTLRIGAVAGAAPYYSKDLATGQWQGFMIDFAQSLAASVGATLDIVETNWGNSVLDLQSNKVDIFFGYNPTPQRALVVDFSDPLFNNAFVLLARKDFNAGTWESINRPETRIAVDMGSSHDQMITRSCPNATVSRLEKANDATLAVQTGRADAQVLVVVLALVVLKKNPGVGHLVAPLPVQSTTTNAGFRKESDKTWQNHVNRWIAETRSSGKVKEIVLANLDKLVGVKADEIPAQVSF